MKYNFDKIVDRTNTDSVKWTVKENELPMWIADMDFEVAEEIKKAVNLRADHAIYAYTQISDRWYNAYIRWWKTRHNFELKKEWMTFATGIVPAISSIIRNVTDKDSKILLQAPVYNMFYKSITDTYRTVVENQLIYDGENYEIDFEDLEEKLSDPKTAMMIVCNPHNPVGRIWDKETLERIGQLCKKYNVTVISDEIHCDLVSPDSHYIPFASVSKTCEEISITCIAPSKTFNIAGLQTSAIVVPNKELFEKVQSGLDKDGVNHPNVFAVPSAIAAFENGEAWLDELRTYIWENKKFAHEFVEKEIPQIKIIPAKATYLLWIDLSKVCDNATQFCDFMFEKTGLHVCAGENYGKSGKKFIRVNVACPKSVLQDGLNRLKKAIELY